MTRPITADVYSASGTAALTHEGTLGSDAKREWLDDLADVGSHSVDVKAGHADETLASDGRLVRYSIGGTPRWWGLIEPRSKVSADPSAREAGRVVAVKGRGALAVLERAVVFPELGLGVISPDTRYFNFASLYYDDSGWGFAVELKQQNDPDNTKPWFGAPSGWTDTSAWWVGPTGGDTPPTVPGNLYLRGSFTVGGGEGGDYRFDLTADDGFELYVDGNKVGAEQAAGLWGLTRNVPLQLDEGSHLVAVKAINFDRPNPATNVFGFILSVAKIAGGGTSVSTVVSRSTSGTKMLAYPATAPGMTPGHILKVLLDEAHARGELLELHYDFDATNDSAGTPWPTEIDLALPVGMTYLDVARKLIEEKACDLSIDPASTTLTLQAWVSRGADLTGAVSATYGTNIGALGHDRTPIGPNVLLLKTAEGRWLEVEDATASATWGRRSASISLGSAPSDDAAKRQATAYLGDHAAPADVITSIRLEPVSDLPYVDFGPGDRITAPGFDGTPTAFWVTGIHVTEDDAGQPIYELDLETPYAAPSLADPLANDDWANAITLTGSSGSTTGNNTGATSQPSEPIPTDGPGDGPWRTLWWKWVAPASGTIQFSTQGSRRRDGSTLDTVLGVYTGGSLAGLTEVTSNDDGFGFTGGDANNSLASWTAVSGTTYYIQVSGYDAAIVGSIVLSWGP